MADIIGVEVGIEDGAVGVGVKLGAADRIHHAMALAAAEAEGDIPRTAA
jgi:hypothetical protein